MDASGKLLDPPVTLIEVINFEPVKVSTHTSLESLLGRLKSTATTFGTVQVFMIQGTRWNISAGPNPYLIDPNGETYQILTNAGIEPDPDGYLVRDPSASVRDLNTKIDSWGSEDIQSGALDLDDDTTDAEVDES